MSITLRFEGHSDDTFGEVEHTMDAQDNCANGRPMIYEVKSQTSGGMFVWGQYAGKEWPKESPACWVIGVQQLDEDVKLPDWPMKYETAEGGYSPSLVIEAPEDVVVRPFTGC